VKKYHALESEQFTERKALLLEMNKLVEIWKSSHPEEKIKKNVDKQKQVNGKSIKDLGAYSDDLDSLEVKISFSKLYLIDIICALVDRHEGKVSVTNDEKGNPSGIQGIDNDLAFGEKYQIGKATIGGKKFNEFPIYKPFAQRIIAFAKNPEVIMKALLGLLTEGEIAATVSRLIRLAQMLEERIKNPKQDIGNGLIY
jgi:hypothetical protein